MTAFSGDIHGNLDLLGYLSCLEQNLVGEESPNWLLEKTGFTSSSVTSGGQSKIIYGSLTILSLLVTKEIKLPHPITGIKR